MVDVHFTDGPRLRHGERRPVRLDDAQVGAIALLTPITAAYLEYLEPKLNADLSLRVNEKVVAACADHPAPDLESHADTAVLKEVGRKVFALKTFRPEKLQRPGMEVELTASRDVTELRDAGAQGARTSSSAAWALVLAVVLALALRFASRMGGAVRSISEAAGQVKSGKYVSAPVIRTRATSSRAWPSTSTPWSRACASATGSRETFGRYVTRQVADHLM